MTQAMTDDVTQNMIRAEFDAVLSRTGTHSLKWDRYTGRDVLPFWVADMDFAMAEPIHAALAARLEHPILGYTLAPASLDEAIVAHLQAEYDWSIDPEWLVYLPGVVPGLAASCRAFVGDGGHALTNPPIYHHFFNSHDVRHQHLVKVPLLRDETGRWTYDIEAMEATANEQTDLIMLCSPHNPTGTVFTRDELQRLMAVARACNATVVSDEIHCDLVLDNVPHTPTALACPEDLDRVITLMSASKTWNLAGLNCSFAVIAQEQTRETFRQACQSIVPMVPPLAYTAAEAAYRHGGPWRAALLDYIRGNLARVREACETIPGLRVEPLQATYLAWIDARELALDDTAGFFESHGVGFSSGEQFGQPHYLRMNLACPRATLEAGLARMAAALASL